MAYIGRKGALAISSGLTGAFLFASTTAMLCSLCSVGIVDMHLVAISCMEFSLFLLKYFQIMELVMD
ncbi:hypothetical protein BYT27DRAFT_7337030 [Phlegmacium glaucopus]|nr:hypothetical protein BYT27DRAFT_7337030 [Phlegmacium glaucopus]